MADITHLQLPVIQPSKSLPKPDSCQSCVGWHWDRQGFVPAHGTGDNGVLVILEAAGEQEAASGIPTVGPAGQFLWNELHRVGIERQGFLVHNVLSCRPPNNKLAGMGYEESAIKSCTPNLDATIARHVAHCREVGKTPVIVTLGKISFKRLIGATDKDAIMRQSYLGYPFWLDRYGCFLLAAQHPSFLMQGKQHLTPILQYVMQRALEIANEGLAFDEPEYIEDPQAITFDNWVADYLQLLDRYPEDLVLSYDIETSYKANKDESELAKADEDEGQILRVSFCYRPGYAVSVPWQANFFPALRAIFGARGTKLGWNSDLFDSPKIKEQFAIGGDELDAMLAWHTLNSAMPKGLGFVTPFYAKRSKMWKHLAHDRPAFYNAADADMALRCWLGIREDLKRNDLWDVFNRHVVQVHHVFKYMSEQGVVLDTSMRTEAETRLTTLVEDIEQQMEAAVPLEARRLKVFKKAPKDTAGLVQVPGEVKTACCPACGTTSVKASHFKSVGKKRLKAGDPENPCVTQKAVKKLLPTRLWAKPLEFKLSKLGLSGYQKAVGHAPIFDRRKGKTTYDEKAIMRLMARHTDDHLYPLILEYREKAKLLTTYIGVTQPGGRIRGGMPIGPDGRVHTQFTSNPSTLRSASQNPNLQNLPRPTNELAAIIRNLIVAPPGNILYARDFSGIEAVLVGYDAAAPGYMRLARRDVHTFYTAWALNELEPGRIPTNDLPLLSWDDDKLFSHLEHLKKLLKKERNSLYKHLVHAANYMQSAKGAKEKIYSDTGIEFDVATVKRVMDIYFALFPEIRQWHFNVLERAHKDGYLRNAFGYVHRFLRVYNWERLGEDETGKAIWDRRPNPDVANKVVAFGPQSNAAGIIKEAMLQLFAAHFEEAGQYLRLLIHDELFFDVPEERLDNLDKIVQTVMESPISQLPLDPAYGMGDTLSILTEAKKGYRWGSMK